VQAFVLIGQGIAPTGSAEGIGIGRGGRVKLLPWQLSVLSLFLVGLVGASQQVAQAEAGARQESPDRKQDSSSPTANSGKGMVPKAPASSPAQAKESPKNQVDPSSYRIGVEDDLQISVWKEPDLSITVVVRPDGMITMPLVNDVYVVGLTPSELQGQLTEKLKPFVNEPQVTVIVRGIKSRKVFLYGQVSRAGAYPLIGNKTVLELLAEAGGLSPFAKKGSIYILREIDHKQVRIPFNYNNALKGKKPTENVELLPGDIVVVP
jgi:polysaccharide export outer membrane protein